jgi:outer membrane receptor protein involved in Fe transport
MIKPYRIAAIGAAIALSQTILFDSRPALAQEPALEEVTVTARKREETLMDAPLAVTAISGAAMDNEGITNLEQLSAKVPGLQIGRGAQTSNISIRGIGSGINKSFEQSAGMYIDGIYQSRSRQFTQSLVDLQQVEVLRGPQSTLFGKNTIAGAIKVESATPTPGDEFNGSITVDFEPEQNGIRATGILSGSLSNSVAARLAVRRQENDGYLYNVIRGDDEQHKEDTMARLSLAWDAGDRLNVVAKIGHTKMDGRGIDIVNTVVDPSFLAGFQAGTNQLGLTQVMGTIAALAVPGFGPSTGGAEYDSYVGNTDWFATDTETVESTGISVKATWDFNSYELTSITGWSDFKFEQEHDVDFQPGNVIHDYDGEDLEQFSQELRISTNLGGRVDFLGGIYYETQDLFVFTDVYIDGTLGGVFGALPGAALNPAIPPGLTLSDVGINSLWNGAVLAPGTPLAGVELDTIVRSPRFDQEADTIAVFGEVTFDLSDAVTLDVGLRYSEDSKDVLKTNTIGIGDPGSLVVAINEDGSVAAGVDPLDATFAGAVWGGSLSTFPHSQVLSRDEDHVDPSARLRWEFSDSSMLYLAFAQGYKSGGFNFSPDTANPDRSPGPGTEFEDEEAQSWELGLKSTLWGDRARFSAVLYDTTVENLQVTSFNGITFTVGNAAEVSARGLEIDTQIAATENLEVGGSFAYLDHEYKSFPGAEASIVQLAAGQALQDLTGRRGAFAPEFSGTLYGDFNTDIGNNLRMFARAELTYKDDQFISFDLDPNAIQEAYTKINARVGLASLDETWEVALFGRNLTDETTYSFGLDSPLSAGIYAGWIEEPRVYGIQLRYGF